MTGETTEPTLTLEEVVDKKSRIRINITALYAFIPGTGTVVSILTVV